MADIISTPPAEKPTKTGLVLRAGLFLLFAWLGFVIFASTLHAMIGYLVAAALGIFLSAVAANTLAVRIYERGGLEDVGLGWSPAWRRHLLLGVAGGMGAGALVVGIPLALRLAVLEPATDPAFAAGFGKFLFLSVMLLLGAAGEELFLRGYAFQLCVAVFGPWAATVAFGLLFAALHLGNQNVSPLGLANTAAWGLLLTYAFFRGGDLWLPAGLHFGWNWMLVFAGVRMSGFTMGMSGYQVRWNVGTLWSGGDYGPEASILTTMVAPLVAFWLYKTRIETQPVFLLHYRTGLPDGGRATGGPETH